MKRVYTSLGILAMIIAVSVFGLFYIHSTVSTLTSSLGEVTNAVLQESYDEAEVKFDEFHKLWNKKESALVMLIRHFDVDCVSNMVSEMKSLLKYRDYSAFMSKAAAADAVISRIWDDEIPTVKNIL